MTLMIDTVHPTTTGYSAFMKGKKVTQRTLRRGSSRVPFLWRYRYFPSYSDSVGLLINWSLWHQTDLSDDFYSTLICMREPQCRNYPWTLRKTKKTLKMSTCCNQTKDGWPSNHMGNQWCGCAGMSLSSPSFLAHPFVQAAFYSQ